MVHDVEDVAVDIERPPELQVFGSRTSMTLLQQSHAEQIARQRLKQPFP